MRLVIAKSYPTRAHRIIVKDNKALNVWSLGKPVSGETSRVLMIPSTIRTLGTTKLFPSGQNIKCDKVVGSLSRKQLMRLLLSTSPPYLKGLTRCFQRFKITGCPRTSQIHTRYDLTSNKSKYGFFWLVCIIFKGLVLI